MDVGCTHYKPCINGNFSREVSVHTAVCGEYIPLWLILTIKDDDVANLVPDLTLAG